jgi:hypothetical protein
MKIAGILQPKVPFCAEKNDNQKYDKNPISKSGEREKLLKATVCAGLALGGELLWYITEEGFTFDGLGEWGAKLADKNHKNVTGSKKTLMHLGAFGAMIAGFVGIVALIFTMVKLPNIMYDGKINSFTKGKNMDVYIKGNSIEKELYDQMNEKAKNATPEEKEILKQQYLKLKAAKNQVPDV